jgi:chromate reductase
MTRIVVFVGSLRAESINRSYASLLEALLPEGVSFDFANLQLPLYSEDLEASFPAEAQAIKDKLRGADGVLFFTPEYNRSFTGVLKNAIDWASRPYGSNSFDGMPAAILGVSGSLGTAQAQQQLRNVLIHLNTKLIGQPEMYINKATTFTDTKQLTDDAKTFAEVFLSIFLKHVEYNKT